MSHSTTFALIYCALAYVFPQTWFNRINNMPGFYPYIIEYADDFIDTAGNPFGNWSGSTGSSWETAPHTDDTHWNMMHEDNSEVFTVHETASIWGSDVPDLEDVINDNWGDPPDFTDDFDETGWPHGSWNWDLPRPYIASWPDTMLLDTTTRRDLLLWHASVSWPSAPLDDPLFD